MQAHPVDGGQWEIVHRVSLRRNRLSMQHRQVRQTTGKDDYVVESQRLYRVMFMYSYRGRFESSATPVVNQCLQLVTQALTSAQLEASDVHVVVLCGGSARLPLVQRKFKDMFPAAQIHSSIAPDEVMAMGAAKQASSIKPIVSI